MNRRTSIIIALAVALVCLGAVPAAASAHHHHKHKCKYADVVLKNGFVYTVDRCGTTAQAVAVDDGRIVYVGSTKHAKRYVGPATQVIDLAGRMVTPSFSDGHAHINMAVSFLYSVNLYGLGGVAEYQAAIKEFADAHTDFANIRGSGWSEAMFPGIGPLKEDIDAVVSDKPVVLRSDGYHAVWVNSAALAAAGIDNTTANPENGVIERVPGSEVTSPPYGEPSGCLRETAMYLMDPIIGDYTVDQYKDGLLYFQQEFAGPLGVTLYHDPLLDMGSNAITAYEDLASTGQLKMRVRGSLSLVPEKPLRDQLRAAVRERARHTTEFFQTTSVKTFSDGVIEGHTGYLLEDYADRPGFRGEPIWQPDALNKAFAKADRLGFQLHNHSIGDAAVRETVDALEYTQLRNGCRDRRAGITHLQLAAPSDIERMGDLRVSAYPQPYWFLMDDYYWYLQLPFLDLPRADLEYPMRSFFDAGANVASASDFPVTPWPNPLVAMQCGVMRWMPESAMGGTIPPEDVLWPEERVTVQQMIRSFTINGAWANYLERKTGSLEVGKSADLVVLSDNLLSIPPEELSQASVLLTMFRGETVYDAGEL
jgi:predicted amidohydrolase YtcJ